MSTSATTTLPAKNISALLVATAIFIFFPLGLYLLWRHPTLRSQKWWWCAAALWSLIVLVGASREESSQEASAPSKAPFPAEVADTSTGDFRSSPIKKSGRRKPVDMTQVFRIKKGMTESQVTAILGEPHESQQMVIDSTPFSPRRLTATWTYRGDHKQDFILLGIEDGHVTEGGAEGWDIEKAFIGTPAEKRRIIDHYMKYLKNGGTPPFDSLNPPAHGGT
jgi:hypothetical protein